MENFVGEWKLDKNINFDNFLKYFGYGWVKRQFALKSNINLIVKIQDEKLIRIINSTFLNTSEEYILDGEYHTNEMNLEKCHQLVDNKIITKVKNNKIKWNEVNKIENDKLIIIREWEENNIKKECSQIFIRI